MLESQKALRKFSEGWLRIRVEVMTSELMEKWFKDLINQIDLLIHKLKKTSKFTKIWLTFFKFWSWLICHCIDACKLHIHFPGQQQFSKIHLRNDTKNQFSWLNTTKKDNHWLIKCWWFHSRLILIWIFFFSTQSSLITSTRESITYCQNRWVTSL